MDIDQPIYFTVPSGSRWNKRFYKDSPSPPPAPDYRGAAQATAAGNREAAIAAQEGSMVNQVTPYGNLNYSQTGTSQAGNPTYTANVDLSPSGQQLLGQHNKLSTGLFTAQDQALGQVNKQGPMDLSSVNQIADRSYQNQTARLDPQWQQNTDMQETKLRNQGLTPGSEAYDNAMRDFNYGKNDAYTQARMQADNTMPQTYQLSQAAYSQPLNQLNALRTGSQVQNPNFANAPQQQPTTGPNYLSAAQAQGQYDQGLYNMGQASNNSMTSGLIGGASTIGAAIIL